ncbi:MAG: glycosyltransferase [Methanoregulaceae archaeon]|nr:glycosyltransferase [Methanoregulaceae archaeon]
MSVLDQTFQDFEIIVVDDGSTDGSGRIVSEFDDTRVRLILQENRGVSTARNRGISEASADLIAFLDADDNFTPCHLEELFELWKDFPDAGLFGTHYHNISETGNEIQPYIRFVPREPWRGRLPHYFLSMSCGEIPFNASSVMVPKRIFLELGGFLPEWGWGEDVEMWGRIALYYPIAYSWKCGAYWQLDAENRAGHRSAPLEIQPAYMTIHRFLSENKVTSDILKDIREYLAFLEMDLAIRTYQSGNPSKAYEIISHSRPKLLMYRKMFWMMIFRLPKPFYSLMRCIKHLLKDTPLEPVLGDRVI